MSLSIAGGCVCGEKGGGVRVYVYMYIWLCVCLFVACLSVIISPRLSGIVMLNFTIMHEGASADTPSSSSAAPLKLPDNMRLADLPGSLTSLQGYIQR